MSSQIYLDIKVLHRPYLAKINALAPSVGNEFVINRHAVCRFMQTCSLSTPYVSDKGLFT